MSVIIQQSCLPYMAHAAPPRTWSGCQSVGRVDPLLDRGMAMARVGAWSCNLSNNRLNWTSGVYNIFGLPIGIPVDRQQTVEMYTEESREALESLRAQAIDQGGIFTLDAEIKRADGEIRWMRINGEMVRQAGCTPILHGLKQDVTEEKLRTEAMRRMAENDTLTGLANRAVYESRFLNKRYTASPFIPFGALVLFDLDGFKGVNDRLGHLAGDACLRVFAERLSASFPDALLTARIGGDEFAVIVSNVEPADVLKARVARFLTQLRAPIFWQEHRLTVGATSGIAVSNDPYSYDSEELFIKADAALYAAKRTCRRAQASRLRTY